MSSSSWWCDNVWLGGDTIARNVLIGVSGEKVEAIDTDVAVPPASAARLSGLTLPAFANSHSHAFHRALRGRTHGDRGSFWTWRDQMYAVAGRLTPDTYHELAKGTFAEMAQAGIGVVGEFHYVHHQPDGRPYADENAMGEAVIAAAAEAGIRVTLLDTLFLQGGFSPGEAVPYAPTRPEQQRFRDASTRVFIDRVESLSARATSSRSHVGAAIHSVRSADPEAMTEVARWASDNDAPLHVHVSEQPAENRDCCRVHSQSPVELLARSGVLGPDTTLVHATHTNPTDIALIAESGAGVCFCPSTERDLADGIGPSRQLVDAGATLSLGSDSHAVIDMFEEARALEHHERLSSLERGAHTAPELLSMATEAGYRSLGWADGGRLRVGGLADFATVDLDSVRTAGVDHDTMLPTVAFAATAADVDHLVVGGEVVVANGRHRSIDVAELLTQSIQAIST